jgi:hypothetical protein
LPFLLILNFGKDTIWNHSKQAIWNNSKKNTINRVLGVAKKWLFGFCRRVGLCVVAKPNVPLVRLAVFVILFKF